VTSQLVLESCAGGHTLGAHEPLDSGAVFQEAGRSTGITRVSRGGDLHAACIGAERRSGNPWRE
jgi:hypothetical protein